MFMHTSMIEDRRLLQPTVRRFAHRTFGRIPQQLHAAAGNNPSIALLLDSIAATSRRVSEHYSSLCYALTVLVALWLLLALLESPPLALPPPLPLPLPVVVKAAASFSASAIDCQPVTVRALLYAGGLVAHRTTAAAAVRQRRHSSTAIVVILLAALFFVLATLTIAARCYASTTNGASSIVQLLPPNSYPYHQQHHRPRQQAISPIHFLQPIRRGATAAAAVAAAAAQEEEAESESEERNSYSRTSSHSQTSTIVLSSTYDKHRTHILRHSLQRDISVIDASKLFEPRARPKRHLRRTKRTHYQLDPAARTSASGLVLLRQPDSNRIPIAFRDTVREQRNYYRIHTNSATPPDDNNSTRNNNNNNIDIRANNVDASLPTHTLTNREGETRVQSTAHTQSVIVHISSSDSSATNRSSSASFQSVANNSAIVVHDDVKSTFRSNEQQQDHRVNVSSTATAAASASSANNHHVEEEDSDDQQHTPARKRPMPPGHGYNKDLLSESGGLLVLVAACLVLTLALGLVTCVLNHYRGGGTVAHPPDVAQTPTTAPMLSVVSAGATAGVGGMDRLRGRGAARDLAANRDHQVRLHAVHTDIAINLPPSISLPDGEEHPFSSRLHLRDTEQESEIYQKCIRPPPNRTILESESPPPYRSSSAGMLGSFSGSSSGSSNNDWSSGGSAPPLVVRCHSMSTASVSSSTTAGTKRSDAAFVAALASGGAGNNGTGASSGQKTDFIQKTVKIFTGKRSQPSPPAPTLPPVVIVPTRTRHSQQHYNHNHHHHQQHHLHLQSSQVQQQQQQQQPPPPHSSNSTTGRPNNHSNV